jgi:hypothetical protein
MEICGGMTTQRTNSDIFDAIAVNNMLVIHSASVLRGSELDPVGSLIADADKMGTRDQCFKHELVVTASGILSHEAFVYDHRNLRKGNLRA